MFEKDASTMSKAEKKDFLRETYAGMGIVLTDEQLDGWSYMRQAQITGTGAKEVMVSYDLLFAALLVLDQVQNEITGSELNAGKLPFDGSCPCPKHTFLMPVYNEIGEYLSTAQIEPKDLSYGFQLALKLMKEKQEEAYSKLTERIGGPKEDPYVELIDPVSVSDEPCCEEEGE